MRVRLKVAIKPRPQPTTPSRRLAITTEGRCFKFAVPRETKHRYTGHLIGMLRGDFEDDGFKIHADDEEVRLYAPKDFPLALRRQKVLDKCKRAAELAFGPLGFTVAVEAT